METNKEQAAKDEILFNELLLKYPRPSSTDENTRLLNQYKDYSWEIHRVYELLDREAITPSKAREFTRAIMDKANQLPGVEECLKKAKEILAENRIKLPPTHLAEITNQIKKLINFSQGKTI